MLDDAPLLLVAASGLAREAAIAARSACREVLGFLDDDPALWGRELAGGLSVLGPIESATSYPDAGLLICAGKGASRRGILDRLTSLGVPPDGYATLLHPGVEVPRGCSIGDGSILLAGVVLTADVTVGRHVVGMPSVVLTHDCVVADFATVCAGVVLGGRVRVGGGAYVGMAASVRESVVLGEECVVGMGSVVLRDVPAGETWAGNPARRLSIRP